MAQFNRGPVSANAHPLSFVGIIEAVNAHPPSFAGIADDVSANAHPLSSMGIIEAAKFPSLGHKYMTVL